ncbi:MAG TPA: porin [Kiloniellaceae bacterium]
MASSAIVGAAALVASPAAAQELEVSGFQQFFASGGDADFDGSDRGFGFSTNTEIHFNGSIMADNGVTFGFRVELEADSGSTNVDENSIWASGGFGKLEFGNNDGAEDTFAVNGSNSGVDYGGVGNPTATFLTSAYLGPRTSVDFRGGLDTSDATKITYTTPSFSGFSVGVSYTPDTNCSTDTGTSGGFCDAHSDGFHDNIGAGIAYEGDFDGFGLEASIIGAYAKADGEPEDNAYGIGGGLAVSFGGFTIASGIVWDDFDDGDAGGQTGEGYAADLGIGYVAGPWNFSINGIYADTDDIDHELLAGSANIGYNLTAGVTVFVTGFVGSEEVGNDDNDIVAVTSGLKLAF